MSLYHCIIRWYISLCMFIIQLVNPVQILSINSYNIYIYIYYTCTSICTHISTYIVWFLYDIYIYIYIYIFTQYTHTHRSAHSNQSQNVRRVWRSLYSHWNPGPVKTWLLPNKWNSEFVLEFNSLQSLSTSWAVLKTSFGWWLVRGLHQQILANIFGIITIHYGNILSTNQDSRSLWGLLGCTPLKSAQASDASQGSLGVKKSARSLQGREERPEVDQTIPDILPKSKHQQLLWQTQ